MEYGQCTGFGDLSKDIDASTKVSGFRNNRHCTRTGSLYETSQVGRFPLFQEIPVFWRDGLDINDYRDSQYSNVKFLTEAGTSQLARDSWAREMIKSLAEN